MTLEKTNSRRPPSKEKRHLNKISAIEGSATLQRAVREISKETAPQIWPKHCRKQYKRGRIVRGGSHDYQHEKHHGAKLHYKAPSLTNVSPSNNVDVAQHAPSKLLQRTIGKLMRKMMKKCKVIGPKIKGTKETLSPLKGIGLIFDKSIIYDWVTKTFGCILHLNWILSVPKCEMSQT